MTSNNIHGNSFGNVETTYNVGGKNVWHEVKAKYPVGGIVDISGKSIGDVIPAGSFFALDQANKKILAVADYSATGTYAVGDYALYEGVLYKCKTAVDSGAAWSTNKSKFDATNAVFGFLMDDIYVDAAAKGTNGVVTASLVYAGELYVSRTQVTAAQLKLVPGVIGIYEG